MRKPRRKQPLKVADLFCGAGLFSEGFRRAGFDPVQAIDLDPCAIQSYSRNVAPIAAVQSVMTVAPEGEVDVLIAGPPCQGFSSLGRRDPKDARNELSLYIPRWAKAMNAKVVVVENVPQFLASDHWKRMARAMKRQGFAISTWELEAFHYGAPQRRRRAFTIASKIGEIPSPPEASRGVSAGRAMAGAHGRSGDPLVRWYRPQGLAAKRIALIPACGDKRDILRLAPELCPPSWMEIGCQATDAWGRMDPDQPANTLRCTFQNPSKGRYLHPSEDRTISLREGARLQGIPDDWDLIGEPYPVARQIGNGVPIHLGEAVARQVRAAFA